MRRRRRGGLAAIFAALIAIFVSTWASRDKATVAPDNRALTPAPTATQVSDTAPEAGRSGGDLEQQVPDATERAELVKTLELIERGGPFPHKQDGVVFGNREHRLPEKPRGYYHEYTVRTPGERTRGARRVVRGDEGELYYTRDHYRTFIRIDNE